MQTHIGTITLDFLTETGQVGIGYADIEAIAIISERAGWKGRPAERIRSELLAALERDERFVKGFAHTVINDQTRKIRVYRPAAVPAPEPPAVLLTLPSDPWRRRQFIATLLDLDPLSLTDEHAAAVLSMLPAAMMTLPPKQRERITAVFGLNGQPNASYLDVAATQQRGWLTIRSSVRRGMETLSTIIRPEVVPNINLPSAPPSLAGDPLFWERVDRSGECWLWSGTQDNGYPVFKRKGKKHMATRYVYELYYGPIPAGHRITHSCGEINTLCVRPEHLVATLPSKIAGSPLRPPRSSAQGT